jgi:SAM-dependent methyltransferase
MEFKDAAQRWDKRYREADGFLFGEAPNGWLAAQSTWLDQHATELRAQGRTPEALAIADGEGRNSVWLGKRGWQVHAFDASEVAIERARNLARREAVEVNFSRADLQDWRWPAERWDVIIAIFFQFASPALRDTTLTQAINSLKPGGLLVIEGYGPRQMQYRTGGPGILEHMYTSALLLEAFRELDVLAWRDGDATIKEGTGHDGRSHLLSAVIRKPAT